MSNIPTGHAAGSGNKAMPEWKAHDRLLPDDPDLPGLVAIQKLLTAGGVLLFYGGMLAGVKPARDGTSWDGHLFGLLAGLARAWFGTL